MDLFKFNPTSPLTMFLEKGEALNGITSVMWVERYREASEFKFVAPLESGLLEILSLGSMVSHADTKEVMMVENAILTEGVDKAPEIEITGRSVESFLENRIVGSNMAAAASGNGSSGPITHVLGAGNTYNQVSDLINYYILTDTLHDDNDAIPGLFSGVALSNTEPSPEARTLKRGELYANVLEILAVHDLGIKTHRNYTTAGDVALTIHGGVDVSATVIFSWDAGDLENAQYLWSNKKNKNAALVGGKGYQTKVSVPTTSSGLGRRMMYIEAQDIEDDPAYAPGGASAASVPGMQASRGRTTLAAANELSITSVDISRTSRYEYRFNYNIGDIIMVDGNYGASQRMRVIEYVEIEDENGESGYPTLSVI